MNGKREMQPRGNCRETSAGRSAEVKGQDLRGSCPIDRCLGSYLSPLASRVWRVDPDPRTKSPPCLNTTRYLFWEGSRQTETSPSIRVSGSVNEICLSGAASTARRRAPRTCACGLVGRRSCPSAAPPGQRKGVLFGIVDKVRLAEPAIVEFRLLQPPPPAGWTASS